jgi:hypothetical protein
MNTQIQRHKTYLQDLSLKQVNKKEILRQERMKDKPVRLPLPEFKAVRKRIVITDYDFDEEEYVFELLYFKYGRTDQYLVRVNGKQLYYNRRGKIVLNHTAKPVVMGLHAVHKLTMSKFHRIRRL